MYPMKVDAPFDEGLRDELFTVYVNEAGRFRIHKEAEYAIYIQLYTYFVDRYAEQFAEDEQFMKRFIRDALPDYFAFLEEVIDLLDRHHLHYILEETSGVREFHLPKGGFGCAL